MKEKSARSLEKMKARYEKKKQIYMLLREHASDILESENFRSTRNYIQHGNMPVHRHCIDVAGKSIAISKLLRIPCSERELIRGALLHDYFLYDWHDRDHGHSLHGFTHPGTALKNAKKDYDLDPIEENIIHRHMFPLTPVPPVCWEAWIVCLADKYCALKETFLPLWKRISVVMS